MPRLPDINDLGARPTPISRRGVATNPRAGAVGDALTGFGDTLGKIGQGIAENDARLAAAAAKSAILKADVAARQELQDDPDYETWGTRYTEKMKGVREQAAKSIRDKEARAMFDMDAEVDIARGSAQLAQIAQGRRSNARTALGLGAADAAEDAAINAPDEETRAAGLANMGSAIQALVDRGDISAVEGYDQRTKRTQRYLGRRFDSLMNMEDYDGARGLLDANRDKLDTDAEGRFEQRLADASRNRETLDLAEGFVNGVSVLPSDRGKSTSSPAPNADRMVAITAQSESGNRERDGRGRLVTSPKGAQGRMQVMPATARQPGYGIRPWDGKSDADRSRVGEELLAALVKRHDGDAAKAWASYNWDSSGNKVDALVRKYGADWLDHAPAETRAYVRKNVAQLGGGAQQGPQRHDLNEVYSRIDAAADAEDWTPEKRERVKAQSARLVERNESLLKRQEDDALERAIAKANVLGKGFTDVSQLGDAYYRASPADQMRLKGMAEANAKPVPPPANGDVVRSLHRMAIDAPDRFIGANLGMYRPFMTDGEFDELSTSQARAKEEAGQWSPRTGISNAITWGKTFGGVDLGDGSEKYRVYRYMEARAREFRAETKGKTPAEADYQKWLGEATAEVKTERSFIGIDYLAPDSTSRSQKVLSPNYRALIRRQYRAQFGKDPTEAQIQQWFDRMGEELK